MLIANTVSFCQEISNSVNRIAIGKLAEIRRGFFRIGCFILGHIGAKGDKFARLVTSEIVGSDRKSEASVRGTTLADITACRHYESL